MSKMKKQKSVKMNMVMNTILTMSSFLFPLITFPYISRILSPVGTGKISFATSVITYFSMFAQLGIPTYGIRACAKVRDDKEELSRVTQEIMIINLVTCVISYIALYVSIMFVPKFQEEPKLLKIVSITILLSALGVEWLYKALEEYTYITMRSIAFKLIALVSMFLLIHKEGDYVIYAGITIIASVGSNLMNFINLRKMIILKPMGHYNFKRHLKMIFVFFAMSVATTVYTNLDNIMLGFITTDEQVGFYAAAVKIKNLTISVVTSASAVLLPRASYYVDKGYMDELYKIARKTMNCTILLALSCALYFVLYAREGIMLLSGIKYAGAIIPMQIIMPTLLFIGITNVLGIQILVPIGQEKQVLYSEIAGAVVDLIINILLIPKLGAAGAAIGTLVAEIVVLVWQYYALKDKASILFGDVRWKLIILASILGSVGCIWVKLLQLPSFFALAISACFFFGIFLLTMMVGKEQLVLEIITQLINRLKHKVKKEN